MFALGAQMPRIPSILDLFSWVTVLIIVAVMAVLVAVTLAMNARDTRKLESHSTQRRLHQTHPSAHMPKAA